MNTKSKAVGYVSAKLQTGQPLQALSLKLGWARASHFLTTWDESRQPLAAEPPVGGELEVPRGGDSAQAGEDPLRGCHVGLRAPTTGFSFPISIAMSKLASLYPRTKKIRNLLHKS